MRILLINPPVYRVQESWYDTPDFGRPALAYLAGTLRQANTATDLAIIDSKFERLNFVDTLKRALDFRPDIVGFTAFTNEINPAADMASLIREKLPDALMVIGGVHVTAIPIETMREFPIFDLAVVGEGELTFNDLCRALPGASTEELLSIPGLCVRTERGPLLSPPRNRILELDQIPFPAWDLMPPAGTYYIQTARGCPFACKFCMNPGGKVHRTRSVENTLEEIRLVTDNYKPHTIWYGDEIFTVDVPHTKSLLRAKIKAGLHHRFRWGATTHVRFVDDELFELMHQSRAFLVGFGIETGDEEKLKLIGKGTTVEMMLKARAGARKARVPITTYCILGQPDETVASIYNTINLAVKLNPELPIFGIMVPYPGTEVARYAARGERGYKLLAASWDDYNKQVGGALEFAGLSRTRIEILQIWAYLKVFIWNLRFLDLIRFIWQWRSGAISVLKKIALGSVRRAMKSAEPEKRPAQVSNQEMATATERWLKFQTTELVRAKEADLHVAYRSRQND